MDHKAIITEEDCHKILKSISQSNTNLNLLNYSIAKASSDTVGFLGEYFQLKLWYEVEKQVKEEVYFLKTEPFTNENQKNFVEDCGIFRKEAFTYDKILPELMKATKLEYAPRCVLTKEKVLVLEDLKSRNFNVVRRDYTLEECKGPMKALAHFHASSIVYEENRKKSGSIFSFKEYLDELPEGTFSFDENDLKYKWLKCASNCIIDVMKILEIYDENMERKLLEIIFGGELKKRIKPSQRFRNVLTHNDLWSNNIFFNEKNHCLIVDFQLVRYTPPAYDLIMALYLNNSIEFLEKNSQFLLGFYYGTLAGVLTDHQLDPTVIFPFSEFYESLEAYKTTALIEATMFAFSAYLSEEVSAYIRSDCERYQSYTFSSRIPFIMDLFVKDRKYQKKIMGLLKTLAENIQKRKY